jgi:hypothetical protein
VIFRFFQAGRQLETHPEGVCGALRGVNSDFCWYLLAEIDLLRLCELSGRLGRRAFSLFAFDLQPEKKSAFALAFLKIFFSCF